MDNKEIIKVFNNWCQENKIPIGQYMKNESIMISDWWIKALVRQKKETRQAVEGMKRKITHPNLRYKGEICDACSEDFTHNQALKEIITLLK